jgi:hypothetical protein
MCHAVAATHTSPGVRNAGLVSSDHDDVTLAPRGPAEQRVLDELVAAYQDDRMTLVKVIAESALDRLRNLAGRAFADAFIIGKKPGGDDGG